MTDQDQTIERYKTVFERAMKQPGDEAHTIPILEAFPLVKDLISQIREMEEQFHGYQNYTANRALKLRNALMDVHAQTTKAIGYGSETMAILRIHDIVNDVLITN